jgi:uncharacterized protein (TIGR02453 family)
MLDKSTLVFLSSLKKNNNKPWFEKNRSLYEAAKENLLALSAELIRQLSKMQPALHSIQPKETMFRINRDVRFSKDKSPYKTNMGLYLNPDGKKADSPGYYIHIEPGKSFLAAGIWMPQPGTLAMIRQEIDYNLKDWEKIINGKSFKQSFENGLSQEDRLSRPPKGYDKENPAAAFLQLKSFVVIRPLDEEDLTAKEFVKNAVKHFEHAKPMMDFLKTAISD